MAVDSGVTVHIVTEAEEHHLAQTVLLETAGGTATISVVGDVVVADLTPRWCRLDHRRTAFVHRFVLKHRDGNCAERRKCSLPFR